MDVTREVTSSPAAAVEADLEDVAVVHLDINHTKDPIRNQARSLAPVQLLAAMRIQLAFRQDLDLKMATADQLLPQEINHCATQLAINVS